jgi:hypothetical protein
MRLTSAACLIIQERKLHICSSLNCSSLCDISCTTVLQALHCCTASLQSLHVRAAAHRMSGSVLNAGCSMAITTARSACSSAWRKQQQRSSNSSQCRFSLARLHQGAAPPCKPITVVACSLVLHPFHTWKHATCSSEGFSSVCTPQQHGFAAIAPARPEARYCAALLSE